MAKKTKEARVQVILECTEQKASGVPGMSRYITTKNRKNTPDRLELKKYNPYLKKYTIHKEIKWSQHCKPVTPDARTLSASRWLSRLKRVLTSSKKKLY